MPIYATDRGDQLFERTAGPNEIGAAINVTYNADSVLKRIGIDVADNGGVKFETVCDDQQPGCTNWCTDIQAAATVEGFWRAVEG